MNNIEKLNEFLKGAKVVEVLEDGYITFDNGYQLQIHGGNLDTTNISLFDLKTEKTVVEHTYYF